MISPQALLIAAAVAGLWYGGREVVRGAKAVDHKVAAGVHKVFHHKKAKQ